MKFCTKIFIVFVLTAVKIFAQQPSCSASKIYIDVPGSYIWVYDPALPVSANNPSATTIPLPVAGGSLSAGLALMPNINGGTLSPTFYTTLQGTYWYWDGSSWINTGHLAGGPGAVNIAGCANYIYNLVGATGQVYVYNGASSATLLATLPGFSANGPYDLVTDCNCNFYAMTTSTVAQVLTLYNQNGVAQCNYSVAGLAGNGVGSGLAILGNKVYTKNSNFNLFSGSLGVSSVSFSPVNSFSSTGAAAGTDFASCPVCNTVQALNSLTIAAGGNLDCITPSLNLTVTGSTGLLNYNWFGPGIAGPPNTASISVTSAGTYSCVVSTNACPPQTTTLTSVVASNSVNVQASIFPSGNICKPAGTAKQFTVTYSSPTNVLAWYGPTLTASPNNATVNITGPGSYTVVATDMYSGCTGTDVVNVVITPTVNMTLSSPSLCARPFNGSPNTVTVTTSGAATYSFLAGSQVSVTSAGAVYTCAPKAPFPLANTTATLKLVGYNSFCSDTTSSGLFIVLNPVINVVPNSGSVCPLGSQPLTVSGASTYSWSNVPGLNNYAQGNVLATPPGSTVYSVYGSSQGCNSANGNSSVTVKPLPTLTTTPQSATVCSGSGVTLLAGGTATSFTWLPVAGISSPNSSLTIAAPAQSQVYSVTGALNSCTVTGFVNITVVPTPTISIAISQHSVCAYNYNNSPNAITVTPSGASTYTLFCTSVFTVTAPNLPPMTIAPIGSNVPTTIQSPIIVHGSNGFCTVSTTSNITVVANPVISIAPQTATVCLGKSQHLTVSGASSYSWSSSPSLTVLAQGSAVASPTNTTFYPVIGTKDGCYSDVRNAILMVTPIPSVAISGGNQTVCAGSSVNLPVATNAQSLSWFPSGHVLTSGSNGVATPTANTQYTVVATLHTCTSQAVASVSLADLPLIKVIASNPEVCSGLGTQLTASGANSYVWIPAVSPGQASGPVISVSPVKNTVYTVKGFDGNCTGSGTVEVKVIPWPELDVKAAANTICRGSSLWLEGLGAQSFTWLPANAIVAGNVNPVMVKPATSFNYTLIGANFSGTTQCVSAISYSVILADTPNPRTSGDASICIGQKTTVRVYDGQDITWYPEAGLKNNKGSAVVVSPSVTTVYTVVTALAGGYCPASNTLMVEVNPRASVYAGRDTTYNLGEPVILSASGNGKLTWISGEGIACNDCPTARVYPTNSSCYLVEAVTDKGCRATDEVCISITKEFSFYTPNSFTPNGDGLNDVFYIYGENLKLISMEIYDRWGHVVFESADQAVGWDGRINGRLCEDGVYVYKVVYKGANGKTYTHTGAVTLLSR